MRALAPEGILDVERYIIRASSREQANDSDGF
jgi:hypothetical protein